MSWNPPEDKGQAGTVHLVETNEWAYRYEVGGELIMMKKPETAGPSEEPAAD